MLLLSTSAQALKMALHYNYPMISNEYVHILTKRATPEMYCKYKLSLLLHKTFNTGKPFGEWANLNFNQTFGSRQLKFHVNLNNNLRVGMNALCNHFHYLNDKIPLDLKNRAA